MYNPALVSFMSKDNAALALEPVIIDVKEFVVTLTDTWHEHGNLLLDLEPGDRTRYQFAVVKHSEYNIWVCLSGANQDRARRIANRVFDPFAYVFDWLSNPITRALVCEIQNILANDQDADTYEAEWYDFAKGRLVEHG